MRLIDIEDMALLKTVSCGGLSAKKLWKRIKEQPTIDAVKVVRCKDCRDSRVYGKTTQWLACESVMEGQATDPDGYCYLGRKREESEVEG